MVGVGGGEKVMQKLDENLGYGADAHPEEEVMEAEVSELLLVYDAVNQLDYRGKSKVITYKLFSHLQASNLRKLEMQFNKALLEYKEEVANQTFLGPAHSPYRISDTDLDAFLNGLQKLGLSEVASAATKAAEKTDIVRA
ncbi:hypothetical protein Syun_029623 [Stephania yunnanensis]|uniref:Uncharacterized protein n=1 Tax=Stephania yunnanensis TaxID=152371 RepID=A0AAP0E5X2_9MAGN